MNEFNPHDGYRCEIQRPALDAAAKLWIVLRVKGERAAQWKVASYKNTNESRGELSRDSCFVEAVCRYLNAGGLLLSARDLIENVDELGIATNMPRGWYLAQTLQPVESVTHVFANDKAPDAIVAVEDVYVEKIPVTELEQYIETVPHEYPPNAADKSETSDETSSRDSGRLAGPAAT